MQSSSVPPHASIGRVRLKRRRYILGTPTLVIVVLILWWISQTPSHDRTWQVGLTRLPGITFDDDLITITNFRNFDWRADGTCDEQWETRTYDLSEVESLWYCLSVFNPDGWHGPAHSILSFGFADGRYLAVSVEARKEVGEQYSVWKGMVRRYELMYVIGDERDLIRNRVAFRPDDVWLYPLQATPDFIRNLLLETLRGAEALRGRPQWYNTISDNCTSKLHDHADAIAPGRIPASWKIILPGYSDELLQSLNLIAGDLDLDEARARYYVKNRAATALDAADFSRAIRGSRTRTDR